MSPPRLCLSNLNGFPSEFHHNGKIDTMQFIEASMEVVAVFEQFGKFFKPVVSDMSGNIENLRAFHKNDVENREFLEDMIVGDDQKISHLWLLWLNRALEMIERFFWRVVNSEEVVNGKSDSIKPLISMAYEEVLKPYHGFLLQNAFKLINKCVPSASTLFGKGSELDENIKQIRLLQPKMRKHIDKVKVLYQENNLENVDKV